MKRKNPYKYDLKVKTTVFKESQMEAQVENELSNWSVGSTGGISFELPPLTGAGKRTVKGMIVKNKKVFTGKRIK